MSHRTFLNTRFSNPRMVSLAADDGVGSVVCFRQTLIGTFMRCLPILDMCKGNISTHAVILNIGNPSLFYIRRTRLESSGCI